MGRTSARKMRDSWVLDFKRSRSAFSIPWSTWRSCPESPGYVSRRAITDHSRAGEDAVSTNRGHWPPLLSGSHPRVPQHKCPLPAGSEIAHRKSKTAWSCALFQGHPSHLVQGLIRLIFPFLLHGVSSVTCVQLVSRIRNTRQSLWQGRDGFSSVVSVEERRGGSVG